MSALLGLEIQELERSSAPIIRGFAPGRFTLLSTASGTRT